MQGVAAVAKCLQIIKLFKNSTSFSSVFLKTVLLADLFLPKRTVYVLVPKGSNIYYFFLPSVEEKRKSLQAHMLYEKTC